MTDLAARLLALPEAERRAVLGELSAADLTALEFTWPVWARENQLRPALPKHQIWVVCAGRGWGKTKTGAETIRLEVEAARHGRLAIVAPTAAVLRRDIVEGPSGILETARPSFRPVYEPSTLKITWPNGAKAHLISSEEPERIRGLNTDLVWGDEYAAWNEPQLCLDMLLMAMRVPGPKGDTPWMMLTTTPKPIPALRKLLTMSSVAITTGHTMANAANLDAGALALLKERYEGTRLGRQELAGELLLDTPGALWSRDQIDASRVAVLPELKRIVVAIDPAGTANRNSDETGIVACGLGHDGRGYVLADASGKYTPDGWARAAIALYRSLRADRVVAEVNYGGDLVEATLRAVDPGIPFKKLHASRGKAIRAEPISSLYEQRRVSHVGEFAGLEDQMVSWSPAEPGPSPDRVDALVWCLTELMGEPPPRPTYMTSINFMAR